MKVRPRVCRMLAGLGYVQLCLMVMGDDLVSWIWWARLVTASGFVALAVLGAFDRDQALRGAPSRLDLGPAAGSRTPAPGLKPRDASGTPTHRHTQARFEESVPRPLLLECGAARFGDDYCGWCGRMFDKPPCP